MRSAVLPALCAWPHMQAVRPLRAHATLQLRMTTEKKSIFSTVRTFDPGNRNPPRPPKAAAKPPKRRVSRGPGQDFFIFCHLGDIWPHSFNIPRIRGTSETILSCKLPRLNAASGAAPLRVAVAAIECVTKTYFSLPCF